MKNHPSTCVLAQFYDHDVLLVLWIISLTRLSVLRSQTPAAVTVSIFGIEKVIYRLIPDILFNRSWRMFSCVLHIIITTIIHKMLLLFCFSILVAISTQSLNAFGNLIPMWPSTMRSKQPHVCKHHEEDVPEFTLHYQNKQVEIPNEASICETIKKATVEVKEYRIFR
ncbi:hypothetical protein OSB04_005961 [Centaurea solstitialis]|uniref:Uncharacterized protein n=1 Tax=Centaurea solstitialis TaxID=347529 RepID=A0AA38TSK6_9ASTR|nr:hypothetical protein OSB04_005961 [Centaurea solstitialis]